MDYVKPKRRPIIAPAVALWLLNKIALYPKANDGELQFWNFTKGLIATGEKVGRSTQQILSNLDFVI